MPDTEKQNRPATFDHLRKKAPVRKTLWIPIDSEAVEALNEAIEAREVAEGAGEPLEAFQTAEEAAREAVAASSVRMVFQSIGRKRYDALLHEYPPTDKQNEEHLAQHGVKAPYDIDKFAPALIAASCIEPEMTPEQVEELFDEWNQAEIFDLYTAALEVNTTRRVVDLGKAYG